MSGQMRSNWSGQNDIMAGAKRAGNFKISDPNTSHALADVIVTYDE